MAAKIGVRLGSRDQQTSAENRDGRSDHGSAPRRAGRISPTLGAVAGPSCLVHIGSPQLRAFKTLGANREDGNTYDIYDGK